jgi:hypothetical protein
MLLVVKGESLFIATMLVAFGPSQTLGCNGLSSITGDMGDIDEETCLTQVSHGDTCLIQVSSAK